LVDPVALSKSRGTGPVPGRAGISGAFQDFTL
jgi:hypothetical protein